ncbi:hypothetical protein [Paraburkholderia adhaesiva]|uniref:hypothetical protein n=1 Tax=Paraburkholderia adhaesiva TaxID=2883244 RepID=UPI001F23722B|nr:hypothetical protein [Paraburkholderia adhaesiva]
MWATNSDLPPAGQVQALLRENDRLESLAMLAASHAQQRVAYIGQLVALARVMTWPDTSETQCQALMDVFRQVSQQVESCAREDAVLIVEALRQPGGGRVEVAHGEEIRGVTQKRRSLPCAGSKRQMPTRRALKVPCSGSLAIRQRYSGESDLY